MRGSRTNPPKAARSSTSSEIFPAAASGQIRPLAARSSPAPFALRRSRPKTRSAGAALPASDQSIASPSPAGSA